MGKIGKSVLKDKPPKPFLPTKEEIEVWEEARREKEEERQGRRKDEELERGVEEKLPKPSIPGETTPEEKRPLFGIKMLEKPEEVLVEEVPDKRLRKGKKFRIDIKQLAEEE